MVFPGKHYIIWHSVWVKCCGHTVNTQIWSRQHVWLPMILQSLSLHIWPPEIVSLSTISQSSFTCLLFRTLQSCSHPSHTQTELTSPISPSPCCQTSELDRVKSAVERTHCHSAQTIKFQQTGMAFKAPQNNEKQKLNSSYCYGRRGI